MRIATWDHGYLSGSHLEGEVLHANLGGAPTFQWNSCIEIRLSGWEIV
jgi:hypothetical protein